MRISISKKIVAGLAALAMSAALSLSATPADAQFRHGGFGGGFGGFHGGMGGFGGWHSGMGGWGGGWRGGGWGGGWRNAGWGWGSQGRSWNGCGWGGCGFGGWWPGLAAGALVGAAATYPYYGYGDEYSYPGASYGYGSDNNCWVRRAVYSRHGHYIGRGLVNVCR
jgi:hypothetical protein